MISDPVVLVCEPAHDKPYYLMRGRETFYVRCEVADEQWHWKTDCWECDHLDEHIRFKEMEECIAYARDILEVDPLEHLPDDAKNRAEEFISRDRQRKLL